MLRASRRGKPSVHLPLPQLPTHIHHLPAGLSLTVVAAAVVVAAAAIVFQIHNDQRSSFPGSLLPCRPPILPPPFPDLLRPTSRSLNDVSIPAYLPFCLAVLISFLSCPLPLPTFLPHSRPRAVFFHPHPPSPLIPPPRLLRLIMDYVLMKSGCPQRWW